MAVKFDPYTAWLGVSARQRPLTNYQLLGLDPSEAQSARIEECARRQLDKLAAALKGEHASLAKRLVFELESAKVCLLDAEKRAAYDAMLSGRGGTSLGNEPAGPPKSPSVELGEPTRANANSSQAAIASAATTNSFFDFVVENLDDQDMETLSAPPSSQTVRLAADRRTAASSSQRAKAMVIGACVAVLAAVGVGVIVMVSSGDGSGENSERTPVKRSAAEADRPLLKTPPLALLSGKKTGVPDLKPPPAEDVAKRIGPIDLAQPLDNAAGQAASAPVDPPEQAASQALTAVNLPDFSSESVEQYVVLGDLPAPSGDSCELTVLNCVGDSKSSVWFRAEPVAEPASDKAWRITMSDRDPDKSDSETAQIGNTLPVAQLGMQAGQLLFKWLPDARSAAFRQLQKCILSIHAGDQEHEVRLRRSKDVGPLVLDLGEDVFRIPLFGDALPDDDLLTLEIVELVKFPPQADTKPGASVTGARQSIRIVLKNDVPGVEVRMQLVGQDDSKSVQIVPVAVEADKSTTPFTGERFQTMMRAMPEELAQARATLQAMAAQGRKLQELSQHITTMSVNAEAERVIRQKAVQQDMKNLGVRMRTVQRRIPVLEKRLAAIQPLIQLGNQLHKSAEIRFRVFYLVEGREVELLKAY